MWLFLAYQADTRQIVAVQLGKRNLTTLKKLWRQIPKYLRKHLDFDTDQYKAYATIIPENQHFASKTFTQAIEAFNGRIRSRVSRLVRKTRSFSKNSTMHKLAIRYFLYHSNLQYQTALHL